MGMLTGVLYYMIGALLGCLVMSVNMKYSVLERRIKWDYVSGAVLFYYLLGYSLIWLLVIGLSFG